MERHIVHNLFSFFDDVQKGGLSSGRGGNGRANVEHHGILRRRCAVVFVPVPVLVI